MDISYILNADNYEVSGFIFKWVLRKDGGDAIRSFTYDINWSNGWTPRYESKIHLQFSQSEYKSEPASTVSYI